MTAWKIPLIVAAITLPILGAFALGEVFGEVGSGSGLAVGSIVVAVIVVIAARQFPRGPIESAAAEDDSRHLLLVPTFAVDEPSRSPRSPERLASSRRGRGRRARPRSGPDRLPRSLGLGHRARPRGGAEEPGGDGRGAGQGGVKAEARVGDEDVVQAVEDQLQTFPATEVVLVSETETVDDDRAASAELGRRLDAEFHHLVLDREGDVAARRDP